MEEILYFYSCEKNPFFTVKSTGSLGASTFYCKLTETVKWKRYCIFTVVLLFFLNGKTTVNTQKTSGIFTVFCYIFCCKTTELLQFAFLYNETGKKLKKKKR